ncbi:uncharacterized protein EAE97_008414 [Botrytis byssoidea]|uniref:Cytochrome P450 alkane hydroxylase n=1 Tax=Botrytis byssoidea TaxID=139641 RepID=A0A9P5LPP3_9HELO|nr:uncharacterized protein EAE97_008414 [Botrytis byssoidea]KAF7934054.1 hypothetical protein EAE97_008414 [Botrytis byssoidea]
MFHIILSIFVGVPAFLLYTISNQRVTRNKTARQYNCDIPLTYPHLDPIFGTDLKFQEIQQSLRHQRIAFSASLHKKYGETFEVINLGTSSLRSIDKENIQAVYSTNHDDWGYEPSRLSVMGPFCGRGFITTDGDTWQKARALLRPTFSKSNISDLSAYRVAVEQFLRNIPDDGYTTVNLQPLLANLYLETSLNFLIGILLDTSNEDERKKATEFIKAFNTSMIGMGVSFLIGPLKFLIPRSLTTVAHKQVYDYIDVLVDKALEKAREEPAYKDNSNAPLQKSLLEGLAKQTDDCMEIRQNIIQGMMAAQGTTYVLISNTLFLLSRNPDIYERLRDEVRYLDLEASFQLFDLLLDYVFLQNILRESLRIYPVFPIMNHIALRDTILPRGGGTNGKSPIFAPKGTTIYTNQYALHRDEKVFGNDVESFNPDRWDSFNCKPTSWEYMPFGGGLRACVGQQKVLGKAAYTVAKIAQVYKGLESRDYRDWEGEWKLTAKNVNGYKVVCIPE